METKKYDYGMIGLGTMGSNLVLNMSDHGYSVAGYDKDEEKVAALINEDKNGNITAFKTMSEFISSLSTPRTIMMLVPAGPIVDAVINELIPLIAENDIIIDCGNSHFVDTQARTEKLAKENIHFMGIGISGGELGARFGPSIMPGGDKVAYKRIEKMLQDVSAKAEGEPCTAYMGKGAAGHYVKMVHNGIEYALMQLLAETYHILKAHGGLSNAEMHDVFKKWNEGRLNAYLVQITAAIFTQKDPDSDAMLLDKILDKAKQKGTGAWMSEDAMKILSPIPSVDAAVTQRVISSLKDERVAAAKYIGKQREAEVCTDKEVLLKDMESALYTGFLIVYAQGLAMLKQASEEYGYGTDIAVVASIWRGGCIIRAALLDKITAAFRKDAALKNLLLAPEFTDEIKEGEEAMRRIVIRATQQGIPAPGFAATLNYFDSYFSAWLPANMIQAQRDFFGAHTYERIDKEGTFHTEWDEKIQ